MDVWSLVIAGLSLLVAVASGIWAVSASRSAQRESKEAIKQAKAANELSAESNTIARGSHGVAVKANEISEEALSVARRADLRESDTSNVHWEGDWIGPGVYGITNLGDDEARDVRIILTIDEEVVRVSEELVPGGGSVAIECPEAGRTFARELRDSKKTTSTSWTPYGNSAIHDPFKYRTHSISERIDWISEQGKPGVHDEHFNMCTLGDID